MKNVLCLLTFDQRILVKDKRKIVLILLQKNYEENLEVPKRITLKPEEIPELPYNFT